MDCLIVNNVNAEYPFWPSPAPLFIITPQNSSLLELKGLRFYYLFRSLLDARSSRLTTLTWSPLFAQHQTNIDYNSNKTKIIRKFSFQFNTENVIISSSLAIAAQKRKKNWHETSVIPPNDSSILSYSSKWMSVVHKSNDGTESLVRFLIPFSVHTGHF